MTILTTVTGQKIRLRRKKPGPKPLPKEAKKQRVSICLFPHWHKVGKERATTLNLSFSRYVEELIYRDSLHNESG